MDRFQNLLAWVLANMITCSVRVLFAIHLPNLNAISFPPNLLIPRIRHYLFLVHPRLSSSFTFTMYLTSILSFWVIVAGVAASPFKLPMRHPSPNSTAAQIDYHGELAGGRLPNGPVPTSLKKAGITALQLIALNEQFEVAYFTELVSNVTNSVLGYDIAPPDRAYVIESLTAILEVSPVLRPPVSHLANRKS